MSCVFFTWGTGDTSGWILRAYTEMRESLCKAHI